MKLTLTLLVISTLALTACNSRFNPVNWGNTSRSGPADALTEAEQAAGATGAENPLLPRRSGKGLFDRPEAVDPSVPIDQISDLRVNPTRSGAIVHATGIAARQGAFDAELRLVDPENPVVDGVLAFSFRVVYPEDPTPVGSLATREIIEAYTLTNQELEQVQVIRVSGAQNAREVRRR
jgi:hypothetical protein